jgi:protein O-GlcNAc transferase
LQIIAKKFDGQKSNGDVGDLLSQAWRSYANDHLKQVEWLCERLLEKQPDNVEALHLMALVRWRHGERSKAISLLTQAVQLQPGQPLHYNNLGVFLTQSGCYDKAAAVLEKAVALSPRDNDARCNLGLAWFHQGRLTAAAQCFRNVIADCPDHGPSHANLGMTYLANGAYRAAAKAYRCALVIDPKQPHWWANLAAASLAMDSFSQSKSALREALRLEPDNTAHAVNLGIVLRASGDLDGSIQVLKKVMAVDPKHPEVLSNLCIALQQACQWRPLASLLQRLDQHTRRALSAKKLPAEQPMFNIRRTMDVALNLSLASACSNEIEKRALRSAHCYKHRLPQCAGRPITLGYLSYDFRNHPVAHQLLPLFSLHDRSRFRILAFSLGPDDTSEYRAKIQADCDQFIEIGHLDYGRASQLIHESGTNILIDLMGHSHHNRLQIPALRPAPVQVSYLGFLSSTGAAFMDYVIADAVVVPSADTKAFSEKLIRLPCCYQMNHTLFYPDPDHESREHWGLPRQGFVFCCFNPAYKINARIFSTWVSILKQVPGSVLWLLRDNPVAVRHLIDAARQMGLAPHRLIFADKVPLREHVQRLQLADLALDTDGYNGGATTANALWAGLPILTVLGCHWVSRMSASHLFAAGFPELVCSNLEGYAQKALYLASNPQCLKALRTKLDRQRQVNPLFDAAAFTRDIERGFEIIWKRYCQGLAPDHVLVPASAPAHRQRRVNIAPR